MRRLANRQTFPFPDSPEGCPFNPQLMAYARLQPVSGSDDESFTVSQYSIFPAITDPAQRKTFFAGVIKTDIVPESMSPLPMGSGSGMSGPVPQLNMPQQGYIIVHLDQSAGPLFFDSSVPAIVNIYDEGDANVALMHVAYDGSESAAPIDNCQMAYFGVVRRGAMDMRGMYLNIPAQGRFAVRTIDPDGGNNGGPSYPPPGPG
jgi:hypothetical protein